MSRVVRMCRVVWVASILSLLAVQSSVLANKNVEMSHCYQCEDDNSTDCRQRAGVTSAECPSDRPLCATVATSPNFEPSLECSAYISSQCSLKYGGKQFKLVCTCAGHRCNKPYTTQLQHELYKFSTKNSNNTNVNLPMFLNSSIFANVTKDKIYKTITIQTFEDTKNISSTTSYISETKLGPRVEALKQEATIPPDDEDDGEGSGAFDENKHVASAPAAPSSFLPSEKNNSSAMLSMFILITLSLHLHFLFNLF